MRICLITWLLVIACHVLVFLVSPVQNSVLFIHYFLSRFAPLALFQLLHPVTCKLWRVWKETHDAPQWAAAMMAVTPRSQKRNLVRSVRNSDLWKAAHRDKPDWKSGHPPFPTCSPTACQHFNSSSAKQADQNVLVSSSSSSCAIQIPPKIDQKSSKYFSTPPTAGKWLGSLMEKMGSALDHLFWQALLGQWRCVWRKPPSNWRKASLVALLRRPRNLQEMCTVGVSYCHPKCQMQKLKVSLDHHSQIVRLA